MTNPIDVVIPFHPKDKSTLSSVLTSIRRHLQNVHTVYVVGKEDPGLSSPSCVFVPEDVFEDARDLVEMYYDKFPQRRGWVFQQLIKLTAWQHIPGLHRHYVVWDSDTVLYRPLHLIDPGCGKLVLGKALGDASHIHQPYLRHISRLLPKHTQTLPFSAICHFQLMDQECLGGLFEIVGRLHNGMSFETAFLVTLDTNEQSPCSEYELYATFMANYFPQKIMFEYVSSKSYSTFDHDYVIPTDDIPVVNDYDPGVTLVSYHKYDYTYDPNYTNDEKQIKPPAHYIRGVRLLEIDRFWKEVRHGDHIVIPVDHHKWHHALYLLRDHESCSPTILHLREASPERRVVGYYHDPAMEMLHSIKAVGIVDYFHGQNESVLDFARRVLQYSDQTGIDPFLYFNVDYFPMYCCLQTSDIPFLLHAVHYINECMNRFCFSRPSTLQE